MAEQAPRGATLRRRRRPSGERAPLPYSIDRRSRVLLAVAIVLAVLWVLVTNALGQDWWLPRLDASLLDALVELRSTFVVNVAEALNDVQQLPWPYLLTGALILALLLTRRIRRIVLFGGALLVTMLVTIACEGLLQLPRPYDVEILGRWSGYGGFPVGRSYVTCVLVVAVLSLVPAGRSRHVAGGLVAALVVAMVLAGGVLGTGYPIAGFIGAGLAAAITLLIFWIFAPDESFPVTYGRTGNSAHLDLSGARGEAIKSAVARQLGFEVLDIKPFGLSGSAGSSPMKVTVAGDPPHGVFAKLFAQQHLRSDRIYKIMRSLLYGRLEDERRFLTVKRLAQNEDYLMRVFRDAGAPVVESYGVVELTPEREYLLVTDFSEGSREIGDAETVVDDDVIDQGLRAIRELWDGGLAHRDVKPANYLVRDGKLIMIDLGFAEVRPSPWRQAVDLANMMLILGLKADAPRVYQAALAYFTPDEIAEAFAATQGLTVPTQLQAYLKADGRDLIGEFRALAPSRAPVSIQRWSVRRIGLLVALVMAILGTLLVAALVFFGTDPSGVAAPECRASTSVLLFGQAVPQAASVPCLRAEPSGWGEVTTTVGDGGGKVSVSTPNGGHLTLDFGDTCSAGGAPRPDITVAGAPATVFELPPSDGARVFAIPVEGACTSITVDVPPDVAEREISTFFDVLELVPRAELDAAVAERTGGWATQLS